MKKTVFFILIIIVACDDFLDEQMPGIYTSGTFFQTDNHAILALNAVYQPMAFSGISNPLWVFGDVASDDAIKGGIPGDQSEIEFIEQFTYTRDNGFLLHIWQRYYEGISRANDVIHRMGPGVSATVREQAHAEARFLRAWYYFHLVNIFGEIPLKTEPAFASQDLHVPVSPVDDIYQQIIRDLQDASQALPVSATGGRATRGAALGLLAKTYLFNEQYQETLDVIDELEQLERYSLMPVYSHNFIAAFQNNEESVFEIQHLTGQQPFQGNVLNQWFAPQHENGYFFNVPVDDFVNAFEENDPRLDYTIGREGTEWISGGVFNPAWSPTGYLQKKHLQPVSEIPAGFKGDGDLNYVFMRYAEVLLMKAEALNEANRTAEALQPLNLVRQRARESYLHDEMLEGFGQVPEGLLPDIDITDQSQLREIIRNERRVELGFEFHRYYDLMRYGPGYAEERLNNNFNYDEHRYFPIPQSEVDINTRINN
jgi:starch-binding outer membrane protein, SusD/RagB family